MKRITLKTTEFEGGDEAMYQHFINQVAIKVRELEDEYKKIAEKLPANLDDIFEPTIKIKGFLFSYPCFVSCTHYCPGSKIFLAFAQPLI